MPIPDFQTLMLPALQILSNGTELSPAAVRTSAAKEFGLTEAELGELLPSGRQATFSNRIAWALSYLKQAGLVESPRRGVYRITERGRNTLCASPERIDIAFLQQFPEFREFRAGEPKVGPTAPPLPPEPGPVLTPDEEMRLGYTRLRASLAAALLERTTLASPAFFERLVIDLLVAMGYGGSRSDAASVVGQSGDEGIDGIIKEDRLGLETIYVQAKRWKNTVGRPDIQQFAGALQGKRARKGVFITTSSFTDEARRYADALQTTIVLIDGPQLTELMLDHGIGVSEIESLRIWRLDKDYFAEE